MQRTYRPYGYPSRYQGERIPVSFRDIADSIREAFTTTDESEMSLAELADRYTTESEG